MDLKHEIEELKKKAEGIFKPQRRPFESGRPGAAGFGGAASSAAAGGAAAHVDPVRLADAVPGEEAFFEGGAFWRVLTDASTVWSDAAAFHREYLEAVGSPFVPAATGFAALAPLKAARPERICYLDIETTGLRMSPLFLVGLMYTSGASLLVDQLFARDYSEEETVLRFLAKCVPRFDILVTFNGITFDVPYIKERMTVHRLSFVPPPVHIDLLPLARVVVADRTPNHRLQTLETHLCGRKRIGDIPGAEIPGAYHEFVRTQDAKDMANIIHHNRLDLVTMLQLVTVFLSGES
jgi:uncharacterized protein YprB with RNaseH-like and TPR domain